ncbi:MAG: hemolysin family protein, partial [Chloroflexota bacterium]
LALKGIPWLAPYAESVALALVVVAIAYVTLVLGELTPKRVGMSRPESIARAVAGPMRALAVAAGPIVHLLSRSTDLAVRLLGIKPSDEPPTSDDEIRQLLEEGTQAGVFEEIEQDMVERVLLLDDRRVSALMTPRPDVAWLDVDDPPEVIARKLDQIPYSRFPVARGSLDNVLGEGRAKDLLAQYLTGKALSLASALRQPLYVPETMPALQVLEAFRKSGTPMALVIDEYGSLQGLVTLTDILESIVGDLPSADVPEESLAVQREDGSWLVDGMLPVDDFKETLDIESLPDEFEGLYNTVAGFVLVQIGHMPAATEHFEWGSLRFEVMDMDGQRVDKVLVTPLAEPAPQKAAPSEEAAPQEAAPTEEREPDRAGEK